MIESARNIPLHFFNSDIAYCEWLKQFDIGHSQGRGLHVS